MFWRLTLRIAIASAAFMIGAADVRAYVDPCQAGMVVGEVCEKKTEQPPAPPPPQPEPQPRPPSGGRRLPRVPEPIPSPPSQPPVAYIPRPVEKFHSAAPLPESGAGAATLLLLSLLSGGATMAFGKRTFRSNHA